MLFRSTLELSSRCRAAEKEQAGLWEQQGQRPNGRKESGKLESEVGTCGRGQVVRDVGRTVPGGPRRPGKQSRWNGLVVTERKLLVYLPCLVNGTWGLALL